MADDTSGRRTVAWRVIVLVPLALALAWFWSWPTSAEYWNVADDGALVFGVRGESPSVSDRSWYAEGNTLIIRFSASRPWLGGETEVRLYDESLPTPNAVVDAVTGDEVPKRADEEATLRMSAFMVFGCHERATQQR